jgi:adenylosuccinate lyase
MSLSPTDALSPVDGRYAAAVEPLRPLLSEAGLIRERIRIEAAWFLHLTREAPDLAGVPPPAPVVVCAESLARAPADTAPGAVKAIESRINHDVKAVEYYVREQLRSAGAAPAQLELVHFGCTSEDLNNLCYARLLREARQRLLAVLDERIDELAGFARAHAATPMLARTHGQAASPTTLGKEFANVVARLRRVRERWARVAPLGKWNGAVGNWNAHVVAAPSIDWPGVSRRFVEGLGLEFNAYSTQIEPHDWIAEYCDALAAIDVVLIDLCRDVWGYVSLGYLRQRAVAGEVGSSTMPHKVNPIDFENAEGNLGIANALLRHFSEKLPVSRWQRDLSDSTVLRNVGVALAHALIAWRSLGRGLGKIDANPARLAADLDGAWEVLAEAVQSVLRARGVPDGYELLKAQTRGQPIDGAGLRALVETLPLSGEDRARLLALTPAAYLGLAERLARELN